MALKIVTGGTTGAADGTLVSSGNKIPFTTLDGVVDLHIRCDDDTYSTDATVSVPVDGAIQLSYDGGSTWKAFANSPFALVTGIGLGSTDLGDLNFPIKMRQHSLGSTATGQFSTDATFTGATALADVTGFTVTPGNAQNVISWSAVTNRTSYLVDRATNSGFTTGVSLGVYTSTSTGFTDTGLTNGTTYYYRIKAIGTYRFKDSANYATGNGAPALSFTTFLNDTFTEGSDTVLSSHPADTGGSGWTIHGGADTNGSGAWEPLVYASQDELYGRGPGNSILYHTVTPGSANQQVTAHLIRRGAYNTTQGWRLYTRFATTGTIPTSYMLLITNDNASGVRCTLYAVYSAGYHVIGAASSAIAMSTSAITQFRLTANGSSIVSEYSTDGGSTWTGIHSVTDTNVTATGKVGIAVTDYAASATNGINLDRFVAGAT